MAESVLKQLTSGRVLARNTLYSLVGQCAPLLVAIVATPLLINGLGTDRFGILTLAWIVINYFSLFDLGLGRALTQLVAEKLGSGQDKEIPTLIWTSILLMLILGGIGALLVGLLSPWLVYSMLKVPQPLQHETLHTFFLLAVSIPVVTSSAAFVGILSALQRFDLINAVRIPMGIFIYITPLLVLPFSQSLFPIVAVTVASRLLAWLLYLWLCFRVMPMLRHKIVLRWGVVGPLFRFGSWMTVSNIISPLMVYLDRFLIGSFISVSAVAYYTTPHEVVNKLLLIPATLVGVLFPAFATSFRQDRDRTMQLFDRGLRYLFLAMFPITLFFVSLAHEGLNIWLGQEFAQNSTPVSQWLAVGIFINSLAFVPYALVQGAGRPDLTAKMHMIQLPLYLLAVWWLVSKYGIVGAAMALVLRVAADVVTLIVVAQQFLPKNQLAIRNMALTMGVALFTLAIATLPPTGTMIKGLFLLLSLLIYCLAAWNIILVPKERSSIKNLFKAVNAFN